MINRECLETLVRCLKEQERMLDDLNIEQSAICFMNNEYSINRVPKLLSEIEDLTYLIILIKKRIQTISNNL